MASIRPIMAIKDCSIIRASLIYLFPFPFFWVRKFLYVFLFLFISSFADRTPKLSKSPSLPDLYGNPFELPDRRESLILYGFDSNSLLINGYATFINKNKYHRRTSTCPSINNDDLSVSQKSYRAIEKHAQWQANTYV